MNVSMGVALCMLGLILLHQHQPILGLPLFIAGFFVDESQTKVAGVLIFKQLAVLQRMFESFYCKRFYQGCIESIFLAVFHLLVNC